MRVIPFLISTTLKLMSSPRRLSASFVEIAKLLLVDGCNSFHRLDLHDDFVLDYQIRVKACINSDRFS